MAAARNKGESAAGRRGDCGELWSSIASALKGRSSALGWIQSVIFILSAAFGFLGGPLEKRRDWILIGLAILLLIVGTVLGRALEWAQRKVDEAQREAAAKTLVAVKAALRPVAELIATMPALPRRQCESRLKEVAHQVTGSMDLILENVRGLRTVVYQLTDPDTMEPIAYNGGDGTRPGSFKRHPRGTPDPAFTRLVANELFRSPNARKEPGRSHSAKTYLSYISVPIVSETTGYGMLTLDAPDAAAFTQSDEDLCVFVAELLAIAFRTAAEKP